MLALLNALNAGLLQGQQVQKFAEAQRDAAHAAADDADASFATAAAAAAAAAADATAAANAAAAAAAADAAATAADAATTAATDADADVANAAAAADLQALQRLPQNAPLPSELLHAPVWSLHTQPATSALEGKPRAQQALQAQEALFHDRLQALGMADVVWTQYQAWRDGRFDLAWMAHCLRMPESVASEPEAALAYLRAAPSEQARLFQARVLVLGDGGVGKTTLIKRLLDPSQTLPQAEPTTPRIEVSEQTLLLQVQEGPAGQATPVPQKPEGTGTGPTKDPSAAQDVAQSAAQDAAQDAAQSAAQSAAPSVQAQPVTAYFWDFGGQGWMHSAHQFFLREQALYVVLVNLRENNHHERLLYWLEHVKLFGKGSPALVVYSKLDELPDGQPLSPDFDPAQLRRDYGFIQGFFHLSSDLSQAAYRQRFENFQTVLHGLIASPQVLGGGTLRKWNELSQALQAQYRQKAVIQRPEAEQLALQIGLQKDEIGPALKALDRLGLALQFDDFKIEGDWVVLDPNWIILTLYHVLQYGQTQRFHGKLNLEKIRLAFMDEAGRALSQRLTLPFDTQGDAHGRFLLELLLHFELAFKVPSRYELGGNAILSPMLADHTVPEHPFRDGQLPPDTLQFEVRFARLLPEAVLHQFAARSAPEVWGDGRIWRTGVWLQAPASQAVVSQDSAARTLSLRVTGSGAGVHLARLRLRLFELLFGENSAYREAEVECRAFMNGQPFDWQEVLEACAESPFETLRGKGRLKVLAKDLVLQGVPERQQRSPQTMQELDAGLNREAEILASRSARERGPDETVWMARALRAEGERDGLEKGITLMQTLVGGQKIDLAGLFSVNNHMSQHGASAAVSASTQSAAHAEAHAQAQAQALALVQQQIALCDSASMHLMDLKTEVGRALTASDAPAPDCDKALRQLGVEIENLLGQVAQHRINVQDSGMAAPQKKQFFERLQKGWAALNQSLEQISGLLDRANQASDKAVKLGEKAAALLHHPGVREVWEPLVKCIGQLLA